MANHTATHHTTPHHTTPPWKGQAHVPPPPPPPPASLRRGPAATATRQSSGDHTFRFLAWEQVKYKAIPGWIQHMVHLQLENGTIGIQCNSDGASYDDTHHSK